MSVADRPRPVMSMSPSAALPLELLPPSTKRLIGAGVLLLNLAFLAALWRIHPVLPAIADAGVLWVRSLPAGETAPPEPAPSPAPAWPAPRLVVPEVPQIQERMPEPAVVTAPSPAPAAEAVSQARVSGVASAASSAAAAAPAPPPEQPRTVSISAVSYLEPPVLQYPLASRRAREQGQVQVRLLVDVQGRPQQANVVRTSGFPRLDDAALATARATRFRPHTEDGVPRAFWVVMPLLFELDG